MAGRPQLARALDDLGTGDELVIAEWDRATRDLARSYGVSISTISRLADKEILTRTAKLG